MSTDDDEVCIYCVMEMCFLCDTPKYNKEDEEAEPDCCCDGTHGRLTLSPVGKVGRPVKESPDYSKLPKRFVTKGHRDETVDRVNGRPFLEPDQLTSPVEVGRARAKDVAPIPDEYECEWSMLEFAGGGIVPIIGCIGNMAADRHHGPDKSTLNNAVGTNLHRICEECHNRWHQLNDEYYGPRPANNGVGYLPLSEYGECKPHDRSTRTTTGTIADHYRWWRLPAKSRPAYRQWGSTPVHSS